MKSKVQCMLDNNVLSYISHTSECGQAIEDAMDEYADQFKPKWETDSKLISEIADVERLVVAFDNGTWLPYNSENWPFAEAIGWILLPELP